MAFTRARRQASDLDHAAAMAALFDLLGEVLPTGAGWVAIHCIDPEHDDGEKSASVNPWLGGYRCHACGLTGDAYALYQDFYGGTFNEAVAALGGSRDSGPNRTLQEPEPTGVGSRAWL